MISGAIFDMDGVLVDNLWHHVAAWRRLGEELGKSLTDEEIRATFGQRNQEMLRTLIGVEFTVEESARHADRKEEIYRELMAQDLARAEVPGLRPLVAELRREGFGLAVATSGPMANVEFVLSGLGLDGVFEAVLTGADVSRGKPHPDVFLLAAARLGLKPRECVVFEDSPSGVKAALAAGCFCFALTTSHSAEELRGLGPQRLASDFRSVSAGKLRGMG